MLYYDVYLKSAVLWGHFREFIDNFLFAFKKVLGIIGALLVTKLLDGFWRAILIIFNDNLSKVF